MSRNESDGTPKEDGLGREGTIPDSDDGIAVGHDPDASNFNPEEDTDSDAGGVQR